MAQLLAPTFITALDANGTPISSATLTFYLTGTTTPAAIYADADMNTTLSNPLTADSAGRFAPVYLDNAVTYRVVLKDASGTSIKDVDPVNADADEYVLKTSLPTDVRDAPFSATAGASDQTAAVLAGFGTLGTSWQGQVSSPIGVRLDLQQVVDAIPDKAVMSGTTVFQTGSGYRQQLIWDADNPPDANTDTARAIISSHYPDLMVNNTRTAGTSSATKGLSGMSWARGFFRNGSKGPRVQWQANFTKSSVRTTEYTNNGLACYTLVTRSPERAANYEEWFNGISVTTGDYILATNGYFYKATTTGTSTVSPTHSSGTVAVGGITWDFVSSWIPFGTVFYVDELARVGNTPCATGITQHWKQNPEDAENFVVRYDAGGNSKTIEWRLRPTDSGGNLVAVPYFQATDSVGVRTLDSVGSRILYQLTDARGLSLHTWGLAAVTAADGDTTPTVAAGARLVLSNTGATSITGFDDPLPDQRMELYFTNGNTTLVNSGTLILRGGVNVTPAANQVITIARNPANSAWVEVGRNF